MDPFEKKVNKKTWEQTVKQRSGIFALLNTEFIHNDDVLAKTSKLSIFYFLDQVRQSKLLLPIESS